VAEQQSVCTHFPILSPLLILLLFSNNLPVKLHSGSLAVFSPVALTPTVRQKLTSLSPNASVSYLISPDLEHHIFLSSWSSAFPSAHVIAPEGLAEKRAKQSASDKSVTNVPISTVFTAKDKSGVKVGGEFDEEFEYEYVDAHPNKELVFYHKPSRTLIEADLLFNLPATEQYSRTGIDPTTGWATKLFAGLQHTKGSAIWQKRMLWYVFSSSDRAGFNKSIQRINSWPFENVVPCHGDTFIGDGKSVFEKVFGWHLEGKK
jgi:hypothetical protein